MVPRLQSFRFLYLELFEKFVYKEEIGNIWKRIIINKCEDIKKNSR